MAEVANALDEYSILYATFALKLMLLSFVMIKLMGTKVKLTA